ncbi:hypothetical protein GJ496_001163 [Pomphorhynchus laevis]|nr:hypothetical protein GJ496_011198 [Pomphorhynchus laevis]KAI0987952.1 hypothetical protein GJ496_001163 [Pomphorhynchus laevis]
MTTGRTTSAIKMLDKEDTISCIHELDSLVDGKSVREILQDLHPSGETGEISALTRENFEDTPALLINFREYWC